MTCALRRREWKIRVDATLTPRSTCDEFVAHGAVDAFEGDESVSHREWREVVSRNGV